MNTVNLNDPFYILERKSKRKNGIQYSYYISVPIEFIKQKQLTTEKRYTAELHEVEET